MATLKLHVRHSILIDNTEADFTFVLSQIFKEINMYGLFQHFLQSEKFLVKNSFIKISEKKICFSSAVVFVISCHEVGI